MKRTIKWGLAILVGIGIVALVLMLIAKASFARALDAGIRSYKSFDYPTAERFFRQALGWRPFSAEAMEWLGVSLAAQAKDTEAEKLLTKALSRGRDDLEIRFALGGIAQRKADFQAAKEEYEKALGFNPNKSEIYRMLAVVLVGLNDMNAALDQALKATQIESTNGWAWSTLSGIYSALGKYEDALTASGKAISLLPHFCGGYNNKADALMHLGKYAEAQDSASRAIELGLVQRNGKGQGCALIAYITRAEALEAQKKFGQARRDYETATQLTLPAEYYRQYQNIANERAQKLKSQGF